MECNSNSTLQRKQNLVKYSSSYQKQPIVKRKKKKEAKCYFHSYMFIYLENKVLSEKEY